MKCFDKMITIALFAALMATPLVNAQVHLMLDESTLLPGTPTGLTIVVNNRGLNPLQLPPALWLVATNEGATFRINPYNERANASIWIGDEQRAVLPGETRELRFDPNGTEGGF